MRVQRARSAETDYRIRRSSAETEYHPRRGKKRETRNQRLSGNVGSSSSDDGRCDEEKGKNAGNRVRAKSGTSSYFHLRKSRCESETTRNRQAKGEKSKKMEAHIQQLQNIVENNLVEKTKMQDEKDHQTRLIDRLINTVDNLQKEMTEVSDNRDALDSQVRNSLMKREDEADAEKKKLQNRCHNLEEKSVMLNSEKGKLEEELCHAKNEIEEMKQVNRSSKSRAKRSDSERQRLISRCQSLKESGAQAIAEKGKLEVELTAARDEIAQMRQEGGLHGNNRMTGPADQMLGGQERKEFQWLYCKAWMQ